MKRNPCPPVVSIAAVGMVLLLAATSAKAAPPTLVNYQGKVADGGGDVTGSFPMVFTIYPSEVGGAPLWTEAVPAVSVAGGLFNVLLGQVTALPEDVFDGNGRWLEVTFDGEILTPRTRLVTVPYAHRISTVDGSTGGNITGEVIVNSTSGANALEAYNTGLGRAGYFQIANPANTEAAVIGFTNGTGQAGAFVNISGGLGVRTAGGISVGNYDQIERILLNPHGNEFAGQIDLFQSNGTKSIDIRATEAAGESGQMNFYKGVVNTIAISGSSGTQGSDITMSNAAGTANLFIDGEAAGGGGRISIYNGSDATMGGVSSGYLQLGSSGSQNVIFDNNEIMSRDAGQEAELHLQADGGAVMIGANGITAPSGYVLVVDGKTIMEEVEVQLSEDWPDYVFEPDYNLMPLSDLEAHIRANRHLPGIPPADEMEGERLPLGEMQTKLLEKVEELTLYVLSLNKQVNDLNAANDALRTRVNELEGNR